MAQKPKSCIIDVPQCIVASTAVRIGVQPRLPRVVACAVWLCGVVGRDDLGAFVGRSVRRQS